MQIHSNITKKNLKNESRHQSRNFCWSDYESDYYNFNNRKKNTLCAFFTAFLRFRFYGNVVTIQCFPLGNLFWYNNNNKRVILYSFWDNNYITSHRYYEMAFYDYFENASYCNTTYFECVFWSQYSRDTIFAIQHSKNSDVAMLLVCTSNNNEIKSNSAVSNVPPLPHVFISVLRVKLIKHLHTRVI